MSITRLGNGASIGIDTLTDSGGSSACPSVPGHGGQSSRSTYWGTETQTQGFTLSQAVTLVEVWLWVASGTVPSSSTLTLYDNADNEIAVFTTDALASTNTYAMFFAAEVVDLAAGSYYWSTSGITPGIVGSGSTAVFGAVSAVGPYKVDGTAQSFCEQFRLTYLTAAA